MLKIKSLLFCLVLCALITNSLSNPIEEHEEETPNDVSESSDEEYYDEYDAEYDEEDNFRFKKRAARSDVQPKPSRHGAGHSQHAKHTGPKPAAVNNKRSAHYKAKCQVFQ